MKKIGLALAWCAPVLMVVMMVFWYRKTGGQPPVPFLLLFVAVLLASFGGMLAGAFAGAIASGFVIYAAMIGFGPASLTGNLVVATAGCILYLFVGSVFGRTQDRNKFLVQTLTNARSSLEATVHKRTRDLQSVNEDLRKEVIEHEQVARELEKSESLIRHRQRLESLGILAGGIAHDFNNLLTSIRANSSLLSATSDDADSLKKFEEIDQATQHATNLCRQMQSYAGEKHGEHSAVDIEQLVNETIGFVQSSASKNIQFALHCEEPIVVQAYGSLIEQVVLNLLMNAAEAIKNSGSVSATLRIVHLTDEALSNYLLSDTLPPGQYVSIEISDDGEGISPDNIAKVFDPFYTSKFAGRGLGLAVVFGAARSHGGAIGVRSEPGTGSTFSFILPYAAGEVALPLAVGSDSPEASELPVPKQENKQHKTVLVVDDQDAVRKVAVLILRREGWSVIEARDGVEAVESCRTCPGLAAVVLDMTMPKMNGIEALAKMSALDPNLPVILTSGYKPESIEGVQPSAFLAKPFSAGQLIAIVAQVARP